MDLKVHRAITYLGMKRAAKRLQNFDIFDEFTPIWQGNWLTDMNQASAFFALFDDRFDHYQASHDHQYHLPSLIAEHQDEWVALFNGLWTTE